MPLRRQPPQFIQKFAGVLRQSQQRGPTKIKNVPIIIEINRPKASRECRVKDQKAAEKVRGFVGK
jgi:hypothetical protein